MQNFSIAYQNGIKYVRRWEYLIVGGNGYRPLKQQHFDYLCFEKK